MFTEKEIAYIRSQRLARIGTVSADSQPDISPVGFEFDGEYFYIGGMNNAATRKYKNVVKGNSQVALAIDDLESVDPWAPRGIKLYGTADIVERQGYAGRSSYLRIRPTISWSWNLEGPAMVEGRFVPHKTVHE
ncbi:MAG: PPOX class F420-dependent oxidoreductase [Anaerolineales bacterium]|nr:PPOX class F420-dependent oxidoreductase [Anaerolineales bacterium]